jgi:predicted aminopeptidase
VISSSQLALNTRKRLEKLYAQPLSAEVMRQRKAAKSSNALRREYRQMRDSQWGGDKRYDAWINAADEQRAAAAVRAV